MNCRTCGTPLPLGAANCPQCGTATPFYAAAMKVAPDDPTIASSFETVAPPPPPNPYGSAAYHVPHESAALAPRAPGPPLPTRAGKRIGLIVGALLLVVLVIGGGGLAWRMYASESHAATAAGTTTATAQAHASATASAVAASQPFSANGTATIVKSTTTATRQEGSNKIESQMQQGVTTGDIMGSYTADSHPLTAFKQGRTSWTYRQ